LQQQLPDESGGSDNVDDDALLACLDQDSDNPDSDQTGPDAARRKRQKLQQDADGVNGGQGFEQHGEDDRTDWWDPHELDNQGSEEAAEGTGQQEGSKAEGKQQQVALEEGDYPEADEEAIRLEAVSAGLDCGCADLTNLKLCTCEWHHQGRQRCSACNSSSSTFGHARRKVTNWRTSQRREESWHL
jgi:hypothetical protein